MPIHELYERCETGYEYAFRQMNQQSANK